MTRGAEVFRALQAQARSASSRSSGPAPTQEYLVRHLLESFLERLARSPHGSDFVLKGGVLLAAYGARRPTKDADANAVSATVSADHLTQIVKDVARMPAEDGVKFAADTALVQEIRESAEYPAFRVRVKATIGPWQGVTAWDVSTGDPIVPAPHRVTAERLLGPDFTLWGYAPESVVAEKAVTMLERGISSTRWRDYVDIVQLCSRGVDPAVLKASAEAVARYRGVRLEPLAPLMEGYGALSQQKWAAWRRSQDWALVSEPDLDAQIAVVCGFLDPIFSTETHTEGSSAPS